mmetsp:Transcript_1827/g.4119  ORF Transcript_1827/g.4119 Transcript_1827/m.4119 type:complete len:248 (+) Transcript_1827:69-812(+)|eukprot:CAMPEP_0204269624 /NCGR_PEP_ID=MMETSP0468-20130131/16684_1 /ASSEMBLY_ACC=CAM_ASM_000383 /TAXON_ID=2969 /ORGANISM="Oxyrrhis marina" /LENGTH=247 /DNA_ID=CAMNT_0051245027 /DNA_START=59 /DNA_END=802 /DNA_ORIENTATION=+
MGTQKARKGNKGSKKNKKFRDMFTPVEPKYPAKLLKASRHLKMGPGPSEPAKTAGEEAAPQAKPNRKERVTAQGLRKLAEFPAEKTAIPKFEPWMAPNGLRLNNGGQKKPRKVVKELHKKRQDAAERGEVLPEDAALRPPPDAVKIPGKLKFRAKRVQERLIKGFIRETDRTVAQLCSPKLDPDLAHFEVGCIDEGELRNRIVDQGVNSDFFNSVRYTTDYALSKDGIVVARLVRKFRGKMPNFKFM